MEKIAELAKEYAQNLENKVRCGIEFTTDEIEKAFIEGYNKGFGDGYNEGLLN